MLHLLLSLALAQESSEDTGIDEVEYGEVSAGQVPSMEVIVRAQAGESEALRELDRAIRAQGYLPGLEVGARTFYMPWKIWEPKVTVHEEGMVRVKARAVVPMFILPTWPPIIVGVWDSPRKARGMESRLLMAIDPEIDAWRLAMSTTGQLLRHEELRATMEALAVSGLPEAEQHQIWILLWRNTAENAEGEAVRVVLEELAEGADWVFSADEVDLANLDRGFLRPLDPEALGADFMPPPVDWTEARLSRAEQPECPEPVALDLEPHGLSADILNAAPLPHTELRLWRSPPVHTMSTAGDWATDNGLLPERPQDHIQVDDPCR